jgi:membrane-associated phospholipid phosphatase
VLLLFTFGALFLILWAVFYAALPFLKRVGTLSAPLVARASVRYARIGKLTNRFKAYAPVALIVVAGGLVIAWAGDQFIDLAELVHSKSAKLQDLDSLAHAWAISKRTPGATTFFSLMSTIGSPVGLVVVVIGVTIVLALTHRYRWMLYLLVTSGGGSLLNMELKRYFARARPDIAEMLRLAQGYSFPSGHAMGSTVVLGALSYLAVRTTTRWRWKAAWLALAWTLIAAIAFSRVYLGVHWISDVAAGIVAGALWVGVTTLAYETSRRIRLMRATRVSGS